MKTSTLTWFAALAATVLFASVATAKTDNNDNGKNGGKGRLKVLNSSSQSRDQRRFEPFHSSYVVLPGDTLPVISLKEYGTSANARFIAKFNHMSESQALRLNQVLNLPSIGARGKLSQSRAPAADSFQQTLAAGNASGFPGTAPSTCPTTGIPALPAAGNSFPGTFPLTANPTISQTSPTTVSPVAPAPSLRIIVGSTLLVDAAQFGPKTGTAQIRIGGAPMKVDVLEWTPSAIKVRLPRLQLTAAAPADLVVVRGDGSIASKTSIELIAAPSVALAK